MTGERGAAVLTGHSRLSAPEISAKILLKKKACCIKRLTKASPVFFALLFCIFGNRGGLPFDVARYLLGLYKQRKSKKKSISEIPSAIFRKRNPNTVLPRHRHRQKPENEGLSILTGTRAAAAARAFLPRAVGHHQIFRLVVDGCGSALASCVTR